MPNPPAGSIHPGGPDRHPTTGDLSPFRQQTKVEPAIPPGSTVKLMWPRAPGATRQLARRHPGHRLARHVTHAVRLFLFTRIHRSGKGERFDAIKPSFWRFLMTWTLQGLWVSFTLAAALAAITSTTKLPLGGFAIAGLLVWLLGFGIEVIADRQKSRFEFW